MMNLEDQAELQRKYQLVKMAVHISDMAVIKKILIILTRYCIIDM